MQYFTETGDTHREAIETIKLKYGDQARILSHKRVMTGGFLGLFRREAVEVTGYVSDSRQKKENTALEEEKRKILDNLKGDKQTLESLVTEVQELKQTILTSGTSGNGNGKSPAHPSLSKIESLLRKNEFNQRFCTDMLDRCRNSFSIQELDDYTAVERKVITWIYEQIPVYDNTLSEMKPNVCILVGPTGVGKTTTIAKLAAAYGIGTAGDNPVSVRMLTADNYRIGAKKQLETYGDIMGIPVDAIETFQDFRKKLAIHSDSDLVLVDTTGKSPRNYKGLAEMKEILEACDSGARIHLTLSATTKESDMTEIMQQFEPFKYVSVILTKLDETIHIGTVLSVLTEKKKPVSFLTFGQGVPQDIEKATRERLINYLEGFSALPEEMSSLSQSV